MTGGADDLTATPSQTVGPFFHFGLTTDLTLGTVVGADPAGARIRLRVSVTDGDGQPVSDAMLELWHAVPGRERAAFGRLPTGADGTCEFETVRPPHVNVCLFARGLLRQVHTRIYFADDPALAGDPVLALVPAARRETLLAVPDREQPGRWLFELRLQGERETVFFDV
jgi:protocatechuate 3,4-dioxygenase alpha subunit